MHFLEAIYTKVPVALKKYCDTNEITCVEQIPKCKKCGNTTTYNKAYPKLGFVEYCGPTCSRSDKTVDKSVENLLSDKDWLYNQRINLRKSKEMIANELGISIVPVNKWIKIHNIPKVKYNESSYSVGMKLKNKDTIDDLYNNQNLKVREIAELLGSSSATVSRFMQQHGIDGKPRNSYERNRNFRSKGEIEICEYLDSLGVKYETNNRSLIGHELDIYIPESKMAIEYNGLYWHTEQFKGKMTHHNKTALCRENGVYLLHVWEDTWTNNKELVKSMIANRLGFCVNKIYARNCVIGNVNNNVSRMFLDDNHIQGYSSASVKLGLYHNDDLVAMMTFSKPRFNKFCSWEIVRFSVLKNSLVVGGFSRLLSHFMKEHEGDIVTYADLSYSYGDVYQKHGFELVSINKPSYWYLTDHSTIRASRTTFMKRKLPESKNGMSEKNMVDVLGLQRIWNSGSMTFIYKR